MREKGETSKVLAEGSKTKQFISYLSLVLCNSHLRLLYEKLGLHYQLRTRLKLKVLYFGLGSGSVRFQLKVINQDLNK